MRFQILLGLLYARNPLFGAYRTPIDYPISRVQFNPDFRKAWLRCTKWRQARSSSKQKEENFGLTSEPATSATTFEQE